MSNITPLVHTLNSLYLNYINLVILLGTLGILVAVIGHYLIIGPHGKKLGNLKPEILRLNFLERSTHFVRMISTIVLAITGIAFALFNVESLGLSYPTAYNTHLFFALLFALSTLLSAVIWLKDNFFNRYDWQWLKVLGGYLTRKEIHPPSGRFNAGQKLFYWFSTIFSILVIVSGYMLAYPENFLLNALVLAAVLHGICAIGLITIVLGHAYLGSIANPGTIGTIIHGKVSKEWAKTHHPQWYQKLAKK